MNKCPVFPIAEIIFNVHNLENRFKLLKKASETSREEDLRGSMTQE